MKTLTRILTLIYVLTGIAYIILGDETALIAKQILKGCLIPLLILVFLIHLRHSMKGINLLMLGGLVFSWAGDIAIDFAFIPGLVCFLITQVMYLTAFFLTRGENIVIREKSWLFIPVLLAGIALISALYNDLGDMKLPVIIYAVVILTMLASAINRLGKVSSQSYKLVLAGAILFVLSDSAIAVNRFTCDFNYSGTVIMSTYLAAQYLIVTGYIIGSTNYYSGNAYSGK